MHTFLIIGGDSRQDYLEQYLKRDGFPVLRWPGGEESPATADGSAAIAKAMEQADVILGPVPFTKNGTHLFDCPAESRSQEESAASVSITDLLSGLTNRHTLFGGNIPKQIISHCAQLGISVYDFMKMEEITLKNTVATAEGAIGEAITLSPGTLHGSRCLVIGFGRCGETLAEKLKGLDAQVTAADCSAPRLALAYALGFSPVQMKQPFSGSSAFLSAFDFIFNTVPAPVLDRSALRLLNTDAVLIDIASGPGGIDLSSSIASDSDSISDGSSSSDDSSSSGCSTNTAPKAHRLCIKRCPGLPGRYCPKAAAEILYQAILEHLPPQ